MGTKIEEFQTARRVYLKVKSAADHTLGRDDPRNDKHYFSCRFCGVKNETWSPMAFSIECQFGYYGSSSGYSATSDELGKYLARAINKHCALLLDEATALAAADAENARKAAEAEAKDVLAAVESSQA